MIETLFCQFVMASSMIHYKNDVRAGGNGYYSLKYSTVVMPVITGDIGKRESTTVDTAVHTAAAIG